MQSCRRYLYLTILSQGRTIDVGVWNAVSRRHWLNNQKRKFGLSNLLSDSNTNVNSMFNRRVSLFYRYPLKAFRHMVCPCTWYCVCVVCPGTSELVGQQHSSCSGRKKLPSLEIHKAGFHFARLNWTTRDVSNAAMSIRGGCGLTILLLSGHTTHALYEVYGQAIWWKTFEKYSTEQAHLFINILLYSILESFNNTFKW